VVVVLALIMLEAHTQQVLVVQEAEEMLALMQLLMVMLVQQELQTLVAVVARLCVEAIVAETIKLVEQVVLAL